MYKNNKFVHAAGIDKNQDKKSDNEDNDKVEVDDNNTVEADDNDLNEGDNNKSKDDNTSKNPNESEDLGIDNNIDEDIIDDKTTESDKNTEDESKQSIEDDDKVKNKKKVYLTFDDGPSKNTPLILDILKEYDVKATFFVIGKTDDYSKDIYRRIVNEGHTIGIHSYTHIYDEIYDSLDNFKEDLFNLSDLIYETTNYRPNIYRFPGGSGNTVSKLDISTFIKYLDEVNITYFDWNVVNGDATNNKVTSKEAYNNTMEGIKGFNNSTVLMHDAHDKDTTVESLAKIVEDLLEKDYLILPLSQDIKPVQQVKSSDVLGD